MLSGSLIHPKCLSTAALVLALVLGALGASAQAPLGNDQYAFKIYAVNSGFYPVVQVYLRTFDQNREPLPNVNYMNIGLMVKGRNYDPALFDPQTRKAMYGIETLQNRQEAFRTVIVLDCSLSMKGQPFVDAQNALLKYVEAKRPSDQIALIAIRDTDQGYQLVSGFEKDATLLYQRIADVKCDGQKTRLYDSVAAAIEMCFTAPQGASSNAGGEHVVLNTIIALSDGKDEGSAVSREELMARIGQLPIPIPIYSLAYSNADKSSFLNLEALSKGSFGRYWTHEDSQQFAATVQKIHSINRSDYVITFRSTLEIDGAKHAFKIGISWPSNTGRFVYDSGEFEAIESPAKFVPELAAEWERLKIEYPDLITPPPPPVPGPGPMSFDAQRQSALNEKASAEKRFADTGANAEESADFRQGRLALEQADAAAATQDTAAAVSGYNQAAMAFTKAQPAAGPASEPAPAPAQDSKSTMDLLRENAALIGVGAGLVVLIIAVLLWVRRSGASNDPYRAADGRDTRQRRTNGITASDPTRGQGEKSSTVPTDSGRMD